MRGLWNRGQECIIDVRVTDTDAPTYRNQAPKKVLVSQERQKKRHYLQACLDQRRSFTPLVTSTDGLIGIEAKNLMKRLSLLLSDKWHKPYSEVMGLIGARISVALVRASHMCLRGSRVPASRMSKKIQWWDGAGMGLFETDHNRILF